MPTKTTPCTWHENHIHNPCTYTTGIHGAPQKKTLQNLHVEKAPPYFQDADTAYKLQLYTDKPHDVNCKMFRNYT
jgi:hypothetical protein